MIQKRCLKHCLDETSRRKRDLLYQSVKTAVHNILKRLREIVTFRTLYSHSAATDPQYQVKRRVLLDGVILESVALLELLTSEDETLLIWWYTLLVMDLGLYVLDSVSWLYLESYMLACECLDEDLHIMK